MTNPPVPEMPDCRLCVCSYYPDMPDSDLKCMLNRCTNGSEFKPAEPIRLYQITSEDKPNG